MKPVLLLFTFSFFIVLHAFGQDLLKKWDIPPYSIELYRIEQVQESYGGIDIEAIRNPRPPKKAYYTSYHILKSGQPTTISGQIRTSKDSCQMNFIDLGTTRNLTGVLGHNVVLNLCKNNLEIKSIEKPSWLQSTIDSAQIICLSSDSTQRLHPKIIEFILLCGWHQTMNLNYYYFPEEWKAPNIPNYKALLYQGNKTHEILFYANYYIMDGYVYSTRGGLAQASGFGEGFWNSNLKLSAQEREKGNGDQ